MTKSKTQQSSSSVTSTPAFVQHLFVGSVLGVFGVTAFSALVQLPDAFANDTVGDLLALVPAVVMPAIVVALLYLSRRHRSSTLKMWFEISVVMASLFMIYAIVSMIFWRSVISVPGPSYVWIADNGPIAITTVALALIIPRLRASKQW